MIVRHRPLAKVEGKFGTARMGRRSEATPSQERGYLMKKPVIMAAALLLGTASLAVAQISSSPSAGSPQAGGSVSGQPSTGIGGPGSSSSSPSINPSLTPPTPVAP